MSALAIAVGAIFVARVNTICAAAYSDKCLKCHEDSDCGEFAKLGAKIHDNCIDCHMPVQESNLIISNVNGKQINARMRNHWIKVYAAPDHDSKCPNKLLRDSARVG